MQPLERGEAAVESDSERAVERVDRTVALGGRDDSPSADVYFDRRLRHHRRPRLVGERADAGVVVGDHPERLDLEPVRVPAGRAPHQ